MDELERCLLVKAEVFVYKIPPRQSARGYRAADWNLSNPDWTGRLRVMEQSKKVRLKLEDKSSGELFAACPVEAYPGPAVEAVTDSSRYFVIKIVDDSGRSAFIGMGFSDRSDSFDLNVALQDHFQGVKKEEKILKEDEAPKPALDLAFKEGQTIKVNINIPKSDKAKTGRGRGAGGSLPPPPGSHRPPSATNTNNNTNKVPGIPSLTPLSSPVADFTPVIPAASTSSSLDLLCDLGSLDLGTATTAAPTVASAEDPWGEFTSAGGESKPSGDWVQF